MSRPLRLLLPVACAALSLGFSACVGTVYDRMYSNKTTHYKPPVAKKDVSAEDVLGSLESKKSAAALLDAGGGATPPPAADIPGLTPALPGDAAPAMPALPPPN